MIIGQLLLVVLGGVTCSNYGRLSGEYMVGEVPVPVNDPKPIAQPAVISEVDTEENETEEVKKEYSDRCGVQNGGLSCGLENPFGSCCSSHGYCGSTAEYCSISSQCQYGCWSSDQEKYQKYSNTDRCGTANQGLLCDPEGEYGGCCSLAGYCGSSIDYCEASRCQSGCLETLAPATVTNVPPPTKSFPSHGVKPEPASTHQPTYSSEMDKYEPTSVVSNPQYIVKLPHSIAKKMCGDGKCAKNYETCHSCPQDCGNCYEI